MMTLEEWFERVDLFISDFKIQREHSYSTILYIFHISDFERNHSTVITDRHRNIFICSGVTGGGRQGGRVPPETSDQEIFADVSGKKKQGKKGKGWKLRRKEGKLWKGRWKIGIGSRKSSKKRWGPFFFLLFFFFAFHFWKRRKFVLGLPKLEFSTGKSISCREKDQEKLLCPFRKICLLHPRSAVLTSRPYLYDPGIIFGPKTAWTLSSHGKGQIVRPM